MPQFSIIIPAFNAADKIAACMRSIERQSFGDYEILIMDGQSSDETSAVVKGFQGKYPNIHFFSAPDKGIYDAMNKGIALAKGSWLLFLGADDELADDGVLDELAKILDGKNFDLVYGDVLLDGDCLFGKNGSSYGGSYDKARLIKANICHQSIFYKRQVFEALGFYDLEYSVCADWDFNQRCFAVLETLYVPRIIAKFSAGGLSSTIKDKFYEYDRVLNAKRYFKLSYFSDWFKDDFTIFRNVSRNARKNGNYLRSLFFIVIAVYQGRAKLIKYLFNSHSAPGSR